MTARRRGFAHLHVHTVHSTLDAMTQHEEMCDEVLADAEATGAELAAIASTDHGTLSGTYKFSKMARKRGVTPLFGNEMYLANGLQEGARFAKDGLVVAADGAELDGDKADGGTGKRKTKRYEHITLLAETEEGWRNLIRINNAAQAPDAKWGKPRADIDLICRHSEGIIALTGCLGGPVLGSVARGDVDRARSVLRHMLTNGFDRDHLFLEIMEHGIPQEAKAMRTMLDLGDEFEISPVATNDAHFAAEGDAHAHEAWLCNATKAKFSDPDRWKFHGEGYWLRSAAEMRAIFDADERTQMACDNTLLIAERIAASGDIMTPSELRLPEFPVPSDYVPSTSAQRKGLTGSAAYLNDQIREGAIRRYGSPLPAEVRERLTYEFDVIYSMGLGDYFLIVQDLIAAARREGIRVGPGRGSAAGCAISYCLDIVNIDPIRYNLLFERFLNPERIGMPDIDIDFESSGRDWAFGYLARRYGVERVARIGSFGVALSKGAIRAAARVLSAPTIGDDLSAAVPTNKNGKPQTFAEFMDPQNPSGDEFRRRVAQSDDHQAVAELAESWEGGIDKEGVHACGVIIGRDPLDGEVPLRDSKGFWVTQWDGKDLDALQFLKLDALALRNLDVVTAAERLIEQTTGERIDADNPSLDPNDADPVAAERVRKTFELLQAGKTAGIFQLESGGITELCVKVGPTTLDDIAAIVALYRPGPLEAQMEQRYALRKQGLETVDYGIFSPDPAEQAEIAKVLDETFGTCLAGDTRVYSLSRGHLIDLRDVKVGEFVQSVDPQSFEATAGEVLNFASMGERDTFSLRLRSGDRIEATADHLVLTTDGWKCVADLREGDLVGRPSGAMEPESIDDDPTPELAAVLGYLLGDGGLSVGSSVIFSNKDESVLAAYRQVVQAVFPDVVHSERTGDRAVRHLRAGSGSGGGGRANSLTEWLRSVGLKAPAERWRDGGPTSADKFVPLEFLRARPEVVARLLAALWDCDGHVSAPGTRYATTYKTISKQLAEDVRFLLLRLGIASHIGTHDYSPGVTAYQVNVCGTGFDEIVGRHLASTEKAHRSAGREQAYPGRASMLPTSMVLDAVRRKGSVRSFYERRGWTRPHARHTTISSGRAAQTNSELHDPILTKYLRLHWSQVVSIEPAGRQEVFDIEVAETQNFVASGMVVHNCIFQEQLMRLGDVVAGFGPIERNRLQKAVSKKLQDEMAAVGELFIAGAMAERRNDDGTLAKMAFRRDTAEKVWAAIKGAGNYAFNASHSYAYGWVTYITAFVKANWPTQYGAALLSVTKKADKRHEMLLSLAAEGIAVVAPRINEALVETTVNDAGEVVIGMVEVRDVSRDDAEAIVAARDAGGPFTSLADFAQRCLATGLETRVKIGAFEGLIEAGAFDELAPEGRTNRMGMVLIARALGQLPDLVPFDCEWNHLERARREAHRLGVLISPNPTKYLGDQIRDASIGGIKASPLRKADEQRAGGEFTTAAIVSSWSEQSGHWGRRADVLLTGTGAAVRATIWDKTLHKLRAAGRIPEVGDLVLVKGKIVMRKARLENENGEMADGEAVADEKAEISVWEMQVVDVDGKHFDVPAGPPALHEHWFVRPDGFIDEPEPAPPAVEAPAAGELPFGDPDPVVTTEPVSEPQADPEPSVLAAAPDVATRPADRSVAAPASPFGELLEADPGVVELPWSEGEVDTIIVELAHGSLGASSSTSSALRIMRREVAAVVSAVVHLQRRPHSDGADIADEVRPLVDEMLAGRPVEVVAYDEPQPRSTWLVPADGEWGVAAQAWAERLASPAPVVALAAPVADRTAA